ncbi:MAG: GNAT family N-acetyltransferase [Lutibacter sp.]
MIFKTAQTLAEYNQILKLQEQNLPKNISVEDLKKEGFVTVHHNLKLLKIMSEDANQIIAVHENKVIAYALAMLKMHINLIAVLKPMFNKINSLSYNNQYLKESSFYVMGQICIDKNFRKKGIFKKLYAKHKEIYQNKFQYCITEVSSKNIRSLNAHLSVGFKIIKNYSDDTDNWNILLWDWH